MKTLWVFLIIVFLSFVSADAQTIIPCGGDSQTLFGCPNNDEQTGNPLQMPSERVGRVEDVTVPQFATRDAQTMNVLIMSLILLILVCICYLFIAGRRRRRR